VKVFRDLVEGEAGQWRTDYTLITLGLLVLLIFVLALIGVSFTDVERWIRRIEYMIFGG
jgi:hypothetical protein